MTEQQTSGARGTCSYPGCERPSVDDLFGCAEHVAAYFAASELEAMEAAQRFLEPLYALTKEIDLEPLTEAMDRAVDDLNEGLKEARAEKERTEASLGDAL